ncbi:protein of unknown function [Singulisphaera sp. GP187]|uniref:type II toxin-antitoxin system toxin DNA ADP-ribosyl transferase DarT n=1 Tax=Singulisphaera sp. GP187 TaxID=1882752 RepID=UPI00092C1C82|nr:DUF4433 domain-containing protein [Singulisphaera sp. GP187]SIO03847.1 protein of unknown function [Singulisphaera sp. GP187]
MSPPPPRPQIYHITHGKHQERIIAEGFLWSDAEILARGGPEKPIGMAKIKKRRLEEQIVHCHPETKVGQYVPFYFCPRSVMLFLLHMGNHPDITYREGQRPILHLVADLHEDVAWAEGRQRAWAFTNGNAGGRFYQSFTDLAELDQLGWEHIASDEWGEAEVKEAKQSEFLVFGSFPWPLIRTIGVKDEKLAARAREILAKADHLPDVQVQSGWYY